MSLSLQKLLSLDLRTIVSASDGDTTIHIGKSGKATITTTDGVLTIEPKTPAPVSSLPVHPVHRPRSAPQARRVSKKNKNAYIAVVQCVVQAHELGQSTTHAEIAADCGFKLARVRLCDKHLQASKLFSKSLTLDLPNIKRVSQNLRTISKAGKKYSQDKIGKDLDDPPSRCAKELGAKFPNAMVRRAIIGLARGISRKYLLS